MLADDALAVAAFWDQARRGQGSSPFGWVDKLANLVRNPDAPRQTGPALENTSYHSPGLFFITNGITAQAPGTADTAVPDLDAPITEKIGSGFQSVLPRAAAVGVSSFESDAKNNHVQYPEG